MAESTLHLWHSFTQYYKKGHYSYQNYHLTRMATNINGTSQKCHLKKTASHKNRLSELLSLVFSSAATTLLIKPTLKLDANWKNLILKSHDHGSELYYKFKNSL